MLSSLIAGIFVNTSLNDTELFTLFGNSIPIVFLPGIGASIRTFFAAKASAISLCIDNILLTFVPAFISISNCVTVGPIFTWTTFPVISKSFNTFSKLPIFLIVIYYIILLNYNTRNLILILITLFYFYNYYVFNPIIYFIDVGQGDSTLIRINNKNILIDTGGKTTYEKEKWQQRRNEYSLIKNSISFFKSIGVKKIDYLILTHGDYDHMGETLNLVSSFKVDNVIFNCGEINDLEKELINKIDNYNTCIKELNIDNNKFMFLQTREYDNENDNSNVIYTELNNYRFLFMGDAGIGKEKDILKKYDISDIDVLKVGHHGSKTSSSKSFINIIKPKYSVISVGKNNKYGHPNREVLNNLKESKIYRTDQDGSIMFKIKNDKLKIETCSQ